MTTANRLVDARGAEILDRLCGWAAEMRPHGYAGTLR